MEHFIQRRPASQVAPGDTQHFLATEQAQLPGKRGFLGHLAQ